MSRPIVLSNGALCVTLDHTGQVRDVYYPHVGLENHVRGHYLHRVGVWVDGTVHWLADGWDIRIASERDSLCSAITARHSGIGVTLRFTDCVTARDVFIRRVAVTNDISHARDLRLYFSHQFELQKMHGSDTAYFNPRAHAIVHYKGRRVFLINATLDHEHFSDFATGRAHFQGKEGSHRDADDGELSKNPIEHGPADSIIGLYAQYAAGQTRQCEYWMIATQSIAEAETKNEWVKKKTPGALVGATVSEWRRFLKPLMPRGAALEAKHLDLYSRSLMYARAHVDRDGGILAAVDSDMFQYGLDTYSYVWMRDAAYVAETLDTAGDPSVARNLFLFGKQTVTDDGYFMHKYLPDGSLGSSWHPWIVDGRAQLPIQEDETASMLIVLAAYMRRHTDHNLLDDVYESLVERTAAFMLSYRDESGLPLPSYDIWERKRGVTTYTTAAVSAALAAAAELARMKKKEKAARSYEKASQEMRDALMGHLWDDTRGVFLNAVHAYGGQSDPTIDISSVYGVFRFGILDAGDARLKHAFDVTVRRLSDGIRVGGIARFEHDDYYHAPGSSTGNPWILTTLWYAEYLIAAAQSRADLQRPRDILSWAVSHALPSGVLSEQLDPETGEQVCAGPLAWAHATYVNTVLCYMSAYRRLT